VQNTGIIFKIIK